MTTPPRPADFRLINFLRLILDVLREHPSPDNDKVAAQIGGALVFLETADKPSEDVGRVIVALVDTVAGAMGIAESQEREREYRNLYVNFLLQAAGVSQSAQN